MKHVLDKCILRAHDIRGIFGQTLFAEDANYLGKAFAKYTKAKKICICRDGRQSSGILHQQLVNGLLASGCEVIDIGLGPTPLLYFSAKHLNCDGAVMITGSHNPPDHNGFKMSTRNGPLFGQDIQALNMIDISDKVEAIGVLHNIDMTTEYIEKLLWDFNNYYESQPNTKIAWDPGNGAACNILKKLIDRLPGNHIVLHNEIDGSFPNRSPDPCHAENLKNLFSTIREHQCDVGFAFDGDADRIIAVDSKCNLIEGDLLLALLSEEVLANNPGSTIIADVKVSQVLIDYITNLGGQLLMSASGHSLIKTLMKDNGSPLGGELSGHIFFADRNDGFDDGIYAALRILGCLYKKSISLNQWYESLQHWENTPEISLPCGDAEKFDVVERLRFSLNQKGIKFIDVDGVRVFTNKGWWLVRASNTQAKLVARVEAKEKHDLESLQNEMFENLKAIGYSF